MTGQRHGMGAKGGGRSNRQASLSFAHKSLSLGVM